MKVSKSLTLSVLMVATGLTGCASMESDDVGVLRERLQEKEVESNDLRASLQSLETQVQSQGADLERKDNRIAEFEGELQKARKSSLLPPNAAPGECYARVFIPPRYETASKTVLHKQGGEQLSVTAARHEWEEQRVLVKEESKKLEVIPARYEWRNEQVLVREGSEKIVVEPAVYRDETEQVLVRPAYTTWKKGRGPMERIDEATGEIMCRVEVPAQYKSVVKHVVVKPATSRKIGVPPVFETVRKRVVVEPARTVEVDVPAQYKTVRVRKLVEAPQVVRTVVPEHHQQVVQTRLVSEGGLEWRPILCETNTTPDVIRRMQGALKKAGYDAGPSDGAVGPETMLAVNRYQQDAGLARGNLTIETLKKLGVM